MIIPGQFGFNCPSAFRGEDFKIFFPIGSYVKTIVCPLKVAILDGGDRVTGHNFEN